jgi:hypothetical protein
MRTRIVISVVIVSVVALLAIFWLRPNQLPDMGEPSHQALQNTQPVPANASITRQDAASNTPASVTAPPAISATTANVTRPNASGMPSPAVLPPANSNQATSDQERRLKVTQHYNEEHNAPIEFYGLVVDQDSNALPRVKIGVEIQQATAVMSQTNVILNGNVVRFDKETGIDGRFEIHDEKGDNIQFNAIQREGYEVEPGARNFGVSSGSFLNPVIFKMWSTNIHEQLITGDKSFEIVPDGRPHFVNLTDGTISEHESGDLKVWIQYTNQVVQGQLYDWSAGIEAVNGGLLEVPQAAISSGFLGTPPFAMYSAPTDGYIPSFSLKSQIKGGQSGEIGNRFFYLRLKDGNEYGRMSINLFAPYGRLHPGLIRLSYAINPSGSRILR